MRGRKRVSREVRGGASSGEAHTGGRHIAGRGAMSRIGNRRIECWRRMGGVSADAVEGEGEVREVVVSEEEGAGAEVIMALRRHKHCLEKRISQTYHLQRPHQSNRHPISLPNHSWHPQARSRAGRTKSSKAERMMEADESVGQSVQRSKVKMRFLRM